MARVFDAMSPQSMIDECAALARRSGAHPLYAREPRFEMPVVAVEVQIDPDRKRVKFASRSSNRVIAVDPGTFAVWDSDDP
jgi:hypothetical protein